MAQAGVAARATTRLQIRTRKGYEEYKRGGNWPISARSESTFVNSFFVKKFVSVML